MACTSPNQWALASPTTSSSSRSSRLQLTTGDRQDEELSDVDAHEEHETGAMLDHVRQLIVDLLVDDASRAVEQTGATRDAKRRSNNPEVEDEGSARERALEEKLARVLLELAGEQDNLRLAANAGNALLEELGTAREEIDALHDELEAAQLVRHRAERETQRLRDLNVALETELQRYDAPYGSWDSAGQQNALSHLQQLQQQRRPSLTSSRSESFSRADSCERCVSREVEVTQLEQRTDELRRRCLELELARERGQQRQREIAEEITQLQQRNKDQNVETVRAQQDLEFATTQLEQQTQEVERVQAVRDTLRRTTRRLEAENEDLQARLAARDELVVKLENSKARATTQLQVAENRTASAQAEAKLVTATLGKLQKQLEHALQQQQHGGRGRSAGRGSSAADVEPCEKEAEDMEQLLQDATREVAALRLENRVLRRQSSSGASPEGSQMRGRRRKTLCTGSAAMTAADVLALGNREPKRGDTASSSSKSESGSYIEPITTSNAQLLRLEIETIETAAASSTAKSAELLSVDGKKRRKMSLKLNWGDQTATTIGDTAVEENGSSTTLPALEEKPRSIEGEHGVMQAEEKQFGEVESSTVTMAPSIVKRPAALSRRSHVNDHCVIGGATEVSSPDMSVYGIEGKGATRRPTVGDSERARVRQLPIEEFRREATESPPKSPLYLGLSFIACATAATAAGLLVRR